MSHEGFGCRGWFLQRRPPPPRSKAKLILMQRITEGLGTYLLDNKPTKTVTNQYERSSSLLEKKSVSGLSSNFEICDMRLNAEELPQNFEE